MIIRSADIQKLCILERKKTILLGQANIDQIKSDRSEKNFVFSNEKKHQFFPKQFEDNPDLKKWKYRIHQLENIS